MPKTLRKPGHPDPPKARLSGMAKTGQHRFALRGATERFATGRRLPAVLHRIFRKKSMREAGVSD
jgi:hypothetical protein